MAYYSKFERTKLTWNDQHIDGLTTTKSKSKLHQSTHLCNMPTTFSRLELTFNIQLTTKVHTLDCNTRCIIGNLLIIAQLHHALLIIKAQVFSYTSNTLCCKQVAMLQKVYYLPSSSLWSRLSSAIV